MTDVVGVRKISDGPEGAIFTPEDYEKLPNYLIGDECPPVILDGQMSLEEEKKQ